MRLTEQIRELTEVDVAAELGRAVVLDERPKALKVKVWGHDFRRITWLPKRVIHPTSEVHHKGDEGWIRVDAEFARKDGW